MRRLAPPCIALVGLGAVVAVAFGWEALWLYGFVAATVVVTSIGLGIGGPIITEWSRRRFENDRAPRR